MKFLTTDILMPMESLEPQIPRKSLIYLMIFTAIVSFVFSGYIYFTDYTLDSQNAMQLMAVVALIFLTTGALIIALYFLAHKTHNPLFAQRHILIAGITLIFLVLGLRFEIFMKLLTLLLKFG